MAKDYRKIIQLLKPYPLRLSAIALLNLVSVLFSIFSITMIAPFLSIIFNPESMMTSLPEPSFNADTLIAFLQYAIGLVVREKGTAFALGTVILFVFLLFALKNIFSYLSIVCSVPMRSRITQQLREKCYDRLLILPLSFYGKKRKGDLLSRVINDIQEVDTSILQYVQQLLKELLTLLLFFGMLLFIHVKFTLFVLAVIPIGGLIISSIQRKLKKKSLAAKQQESLILTLSEESIYGLKVIKAFNGIRHRMGQFAKENGKYNRILIKINRLKDLSSPISDFLGMCMVVIILIAGSRLLSTNSRFTAEIFITYLILFTQIINPIKIIAEANANFKKGFASLQRIEELLQAEEEIKEKANAKGINELEEGICFENVGFSYADKKVLQHLSFKIPKGKTVAICGPSGAGKSTIADLLPRFYDVCEGSIRVGKTDIRDLKINELRQLFSIVSQESILFNDTLFNNIALGRPETDVEAVWKAAQMAQIDEFIRGLDQGMQTEVGDRGMKLSGGERQRINIARAFLRNAPILILDEATSALDATSERQVQQAINQLMRDKTCLIIAHRLSTIRLADVILVLEEGKIIERGNHETLMAANGRYKKMVDLQSFME